MNSTEIMSETSPEYAINIKNSDTEEPMNNSETFSSETWSIFRVPAHLREVDERAYTPKILSIGPVHRNEPGLKAMEDQKLRLLNLLLRRIGLQNSDLTSAMRQIEEKTRNCYSESFDEMMSDDFVSMMVLDGCFIVELLRLYDQECKGEEVEDPIFATHWMLLDIGCDLLMLENQLPMFVLKKLFDLITNFNEEATSLNALVLQFFEPLRPGKDKLPHGILLNVEDENQHLLALFHSTFVPSDYHSSLSYQQEMRDKDCILLLEKGWVKNARSLNDAGVKFQSKFGSFLDIEFEHKVLKIPTLFIDDGSKIVLRNLLAYEQCNRYAAPYFTCLAVFLDSIVDTPKDILVLQVAGIIKLVEDTTEEVVHLLRSLTKNLEFDLDDCYITKQVKDINSYTQSTMATIMVVGRRLQSPITPLLFLFRNPEAILVIISGIIASTASQ